MMNDIAHAALERLVYSSVGGTRFTQGSPLMPDVWIRYGLEGPRPQDLLLLPNWKSTSAELATALKERLTTGPDVTEPKKAIARARLAHTQSTVAVELGFEQLLRAALPLSSWWQHYLIEPDKGKPEGDLITLMGSARATLKESLKIGLEKKQGFELNLHTGQMKPAGGRRITVELVWLARVAGTLALLFKAYPKGLGAVKSPEEELEALERRTDDVLSAFFELFQGAVPSSPGREPLWSVNLNRESRLAIYESMSTVKADAARQVFSVTGKDIRWAVVDTGIDAEHLAFRRRNEAGALVSGEPFTQEHDEGAPGAHARWVNNTRIIATYDFTDVRALMGAEEVEDLKTGEGETPYDRLKDRGVLKQFERALAHKREGRPVDWELWEPVLRIHHEKGRYRPPQHKHGTHVAGILGADWRPEDAPNDELELSHLSPRRAQVRKGVCPEIELYDIRALDISGKGDEFALIAALQFVRYLNAQHEHVEIHGVNLSLSLLHDVANYACGRTPICEECERLVGNGFVVVAAAGNEGRARYLTSGGNVEEGYRSISITDPGNAPSIITVGATHRSEPHGYGVSYFSSRGPTGDGRLKPDLVAPGEKIVSTVPGNREEPLDGTSMAAPHVSGAAALLLCRHSEFIGKPAEIKRILCETAIDLGRERYFQGAGLLDILHALETV